MQRTGGIRHFDRWLVGATALVLVAAALCAWIASGEERALAEDRSYQVSDLLAYGMEAHLDETLRDARNAAYAAAALLEDSPALLKAPAGRLHFALNRQMTDATSVARLVVADGEGRILASSAEGAVLPGAALGGETLGWHRSNADDRDMHLGNARHSPVSGEMVVPYSRAVFARDGALAAVVVAELHLGYFAGVYRNMLKENPAHVLWVGDDGTRLMRYPQVAGAIGHRIPHDIPLAKLRQGSGHREYVAPLDGRTYLFSYVASQRLPVTIAVGQDREAVLAEWRARTRQRGLVVSLFAAILVGVVALLRRSLARQALNDALLAEGEAQLRMVTDNLPNGMLYQVRREPDGTTRFVYVAASVERLTGVTKDAVMRNPMCWYGLVLPEDQAALRAAEDESFRTMSLLAIELRMRRLDGQVRWMRLNAVPRLQRDGGVVWDGIQLDVTESVQARDEIRRLNAQLEKRVEERTAELSIANRNLEAFSYSVAHDLRGPLHRIGGLAGLLRGRIDGADADARRKLGWICGEVGRMSETIDGLLALSRTSQGELGRSAVPLGRIAAEIARDMGHQSMQRDIEWVIGPLPDVDGDAVLLRQAMANLIGNAVKFTRDARPARIEIGCHDSAGRPGEAVIFVRDNGVGFDPSRAPGLFGAFQRFHAESAFEGSGVGLALVHRIVERHGGRVWAASAPGAGATFSLSLPLADIYKDSNGRMQSGSGFHGNGYAEYGKVSGIQAAGL